MNKRFLVLQILTISLLGSSFGFSQDLILRSEATSLFSATATLQDGGEPVRDPAEGDQTNDSLAVVAGKADVIGDGGLVSANFLLSARCLITSIKIRIVGQMATCTAHLPPRRTWVMAWSIQST